MTTRSGRPGVSKKCPECGMILAHQIKRCRFCDYTLPEEFWADSPPMRRSSLPTQVQEQHRPEPKAQRPAPARQVTAPGSSAISGELHRELNRVVQATEGMDSDELGLVANRTGKSAGSAKQDTAPLLTGEAALAALEEENPIPLDTRKISLVLLVMFTTLLSFGLFAGASQVKRVSPDIRRCKTVCATETRHIEGGQPGKSEALSECISLCFEDLRSNR